MKKNLAIVFLSISLFVVIIMALLAFNGNLDRIYVLEEEKTQYEKYFSEIEAWKTCLENTKLYTFEGEKYSKLSEEQQCILEIRNQ